MYATSVNYYNFLSVWLVDPAEKFPSSRHTPSCISNSMHTSITPIFLYKSCSILAAVARKFIQARDAGQYL